MKWITLVIFVLSSMIWNICGQECSQCCVENMDSHMECYRQCYEECPIDSCPSGGTRFGNNGQESYWTFTPAEWAFLTVKDINVNSYNISFDIMTSASTGLLFFGNGPPSNKNSVKDDYIGAYLWEGKLYYSSVLHSNTGRIMLISDNTVNDGYYHKAAFYQIGDFIELCVDEICDYAFNNRGSKGAFVRLDGNIFMGGVPSSLKTNATDKLNSPVQGFNGCLKNIKVDGIPSPPPNSKVNTNKAENG